MISQINKKEIGKRLGEIRRQKGLTQEKLAEQLDVTPKHISHCEAGSSIFSINTLIDFCTLTNSSLDYIIYGKNNDNTLDDINPFVLSILRGKPTSQKELLKKYLDLFAEMQDSQ